MSKVAIREVRTYDTGLIKDNLYKCLAEIGFDAARLKGKRVAVKPNLLSASKPEQAIVTHPEFFTAAVQIIKESGGNPILIESPALHSLQKVLKVTGYDKIVERESIEVDIEHEPASITNEKGTMYRHFNIMKSVTDVDFLFNLPKFKTHGLTYITAAQKNLFGLIPGMNKTQWHLKASTRQAFSEFLVDYFEAVSALFEAPKQIIHLMDAIVGMEGNGPGSGGRPHAIGAVIAGFDAVAIDFIASSLVGFDTNLIKTIMISYKRGIGKIGFNEVQFDGKVFAGLVTNGFEPAHLPFNARIENIRWLANLVKRLAVERPVAVEGRCTLCYQCRQICSAEAIVKGEKVPQIDYNKCIRCFCCVEICPEGAMKVKGNSLSSFFRRA